MSCGNGDGGAHLGAAKPGGALMIWGLRAQEIDLWADVQRAGHAPLPLSEDEATVPRWRAERMRGLMGTCRIWIIPLFQASLGGGADTVRAALPVAGPVSDGLIRAGMRWPMLTQALAYAEDRTRANDLVRTADR